MRSIHARRRSSYAPRRRRIAPKVRHANLWHETEAGDVPGRLRQPAPHRAPVGWELRPEDGRVIGQSPSVRAAWGDDHPHADSDGIPTVIPGDLPGDSTTDIHRRHQVVDVDDPRLELDDEQRSRRRVPGDDVDHASLTVSGKGNLGKREPAPDLAEPPERSLVHQRVPTIDQAVKIGAAPAEQPFEPSVEDSRQCAEHGRTTRRQVDRLRSASRRRAGCRRPSRRPPVAADAGSEAL